jgi:hypothetical protein
MKNNRINVRFSLGKHEKKRYSINKINTKEETLWAIDKLL